MLDEKTQSSIKSLALEETGRKKNDDIGEVGVIDAPDGGKAAWTVVFGSFCVSKDNIDVDVNY